MQSDKKNVDWAGLPTDIVDAEDIEAYDRP